MGLDHVFLPKVRIPNRPNEPLYIDGKPLSILNHNTFTKDTDTSDLTPAIGLATVLYRWCPEALLAFLDLESWFSMTWTLSLPDQTKIEIGRIRNQITFGTLDREGLWTMMLGHSMASSRSSGTGEDEGESGGSWIANLSESMLHEQDLTDPIEIERLSREFVKDLIIRRRWQTGKGIKHSFFIESVAIGMDPFGDGIAMNPHWLYEALELTKCTNCGSGRVLETDGEQQETKITLQRCARCGTAAYCSSACQQRDWAVHKAVCTMTTEERGRALHLTSRGGLVGWVPEEGEEAAEEAGSEESERDDGI